MAERTVTYRFGCGCTAHIPGTDCTPYLMPCALHTYADELKMFAQDTIARLVDVLDPDTAETIVNQARALLAEIAALDEAQYQARYAAELAKVRAARKDLR